MKSYNERTNSIQNKANKRIARRNKWVASVAVCLVVVLCAAFIPAIAGNGGGNGGGIGGYQNSPYFSLIQKLDNYVKTSLDASTDDDLEAPTTDGNGNGSFVETTDNQVDGVSEGDIVKRTTTHAFYLHRQSGGQWLWQLHCYRLAGQQSSLVSAYVLDIDGCVNGGNNAEMYISEDGKTATVLSSVRNQANVTYTCVINLDISNPQQIEEVGRTYVSGRYLSSRKVDGQLLVMTNFEVVHFFDEQGSACIDYDQPQTYIPATGALEDAQLFSTEEMWIPQELTSCSYTVLAMVDATSLQTTSRQAVLSATEDVAVSADHIFVTRYHPAPFSQLENEQSANDTTDIVVLNYKQGLSQQGAVTVKGKVKDRYCMDERNGVLRVFSTVTTVTRNTYGPSMVSANSALYCVDMQTLQIAAQQENFAPEGETVQAVRFYGDSAYVCTAISFSDPVFAFDLSDIRNIKWVETTEISGYSISLTKFGDDLLLGIGYVDSLSSLKVEVYRETAQAVEDAIAIYQRDLCSYSAVRKAHFVDQEHGLVGLCLEEYNNVNASRVYLLLQLVQKDGQFALEVVAEYAYPIQDSNWGPSDTRAFYADGGVYVFAPTTKKIPTMVFLPLE